MPRFKDLSGKKFGKLTAIKTDGKDKFGSYMWECVCDCGNKTRVLTGNLSSGHTTSCGCKQITHNSWKDPAYNVYNAVIYRVFNPGSNRFENYGARGITVESRWLEPEGNGFLNFLEDMGPRPSLKHTIERKDVNKGYSAENCIWTDDMGLQNYNKTKQKSNTSGRTGVNWNIARNMWVARISKDGKRFDVYCGDSFEEACKAREEAEIQYYGFTKE